MMYFLCDFSPMSRRIVLAIFTLFTFSSSQVSLIEDSLQSKSINADCGIVILLPDGYNRSKVHYPVLYLLHGFNGNRLEWFNDSRLIEIAQGYRFIIVSFDAKNSWYTNSATKKYSHYEDLLIHDLIPFIDTTFRTIQDKQHRAIAGFSMGGYGALKYGIKYPDKFFYAAGLSPSIQFPSGLEDSAIVSRRSAASNLSVREAFGAERNEQWNENDIFSLLERSGHANFPYFYLSVGAQDGIPEIIEDAHKLAKELRKKGLPFEMHETQGAHDWEFWDKELEIVLKNISRKMGH